MHSDKILLQIWRTFLTKTLEKIAPQVLMPRGNIIDSFHISKTILIKLIKAMQRRMTLHPVALRAPRLVLKSMEKAPEASVR